MVVLRIVLIVFFLGNVYARGQVDLSYSREYEWRADYEEELPEWVFVCSDTMVLGVSDPYLKPEVGREQAIQRALFWCGLQKGVDIRMLFDYFMLTETEFSHDQQKNKLTTLIELNASLKNFAYEVVDEHYSKYGEAYVKLQVREVEKSLDLFALRGEFMAVATEETGVNKDIKIRLEMKNSGLEKIKKSSFSCRGGIESLKIESTINGGKLYLPLSRFRYTKSDAKQEGKQGKRLERAFWNAQLVSLLEALSMYVFPDVYLRKAEEMSNRKMYGLKREIVKGRFSLHVRRVYIDDNSLYIDWQIDKTR